MCRKRFLLTVVLIPILAGCSTGLISQSPTSTPTSEDVPVISQAELEEIIAEISQEYGVPAMAVAVVTDQGLQQAAAVGVRKWGDPTPHTRLTTLLLELARRRSTDGCLNTWLSDLLAA